MKLKKRAERGINIGALFRCMLLASGLIPPPVSAQTITRDSLPGTLVTFELVRVPAGTVVVNGRTVNVPAFEVGRTEVTWDMYDVFFLRLDEPRSGGADALARPSEPYGAPDYGWGHAGFPAISVARAGAQAFCEWLSARTGKRYRLPTEAEWQHMANLAAGSAPLSRERVDQLAWHRGNAADQTHAVKTKQPDALGLFDLFGNAAEWVASDDAKLVTRGGSFRDDAAHLGVNARAVQIAQWNERDPQNPKSRWWLSDGPFVGFRIVREP
jgi:formylglycine-generating enzyme required for sulfatase activity